MLVSEEPTLTGCAARLCDICKRMAQSLLTFCTLPYVH